MNANTVDFFIQHKPFPTATFEQYLHQAAIDILDILQPPEINPSLKYSSSITNTYIQVDQILKRATTQPTLTPAPTSTTPPFP